MDSLSKTEKDTAKLLVKYLEIDFDCRNFENPTIQKFFSGLQALALNEEEPEEVEDLLEPNLEELQRFEKVMEKYRDTFFDGNIEDPTCVEKPKRANPRGNKPQMTFGSSQSSTTGPAKPTKKRKEPPQSAIKEVDEEQNTKNKRKKVEKANAEESDEIPMATSSLQAPKSKNGAKVRSSRNRSKSPMRENTSPNTASSDLE